MSSINIRRAIRLALAAGAVAAAFASPGVVAQEQTSQTDAADLGVTVVTGSRIARTALEAPVPVVVIGGADFELQGFENFADLAATLPQFAASFGASRTQSTFSGAATSGLNLANLRNLTGVRTVVLINGRRVPGGTTTSTTVDFNTIPTANIDHIELLTGGAAAIYGADAVSGVLNIITKKNFEGIELGGSYGASDEGDNENPSGHLLMGGNFGDRGRGLLTLQYDFQGEVSCADRFLCAQDFAWTNPANPPLRGDAARSGVAPAGRFFFTGGSAAGYTQRNGSFTDAGGALIPFDVTQDGYNRNAHRTLAIPTRRVLLAADGDVEITSGISAFAEINYGSSKTDAPFEGHPFQSNLAGSLFGGGPGVTGLQATIPIDNPFIPTALHDAAVAGGATELTWFQRFDLAGGERGAENTRETVRAVGGFHGDIESIGGVGHDWSWELSHVYGRTDLNSITNGLVGTEQLYYGLRVEPDPDNAGQFRCIDPGARAAGCVPLDPFHPYTQEMIDYMSMTAGQTGRSQLEDTQLNLQGALVDLPAGPMRVGIGLERRTFSGFLDYDEVINRALVTGNQIGDNEFTKTESREAYLETLVPIVKDLPFANSISLEGAYRRSKPDNGGEYGTWKYGGDWAPVEGVRFRAMRARTVRTPVPGELTGIGQTFGTVNDPCTRDRRNENPTRAANCTADGVPDTYNPLLIVEQGVAGFVGGNPDLSPEEATTLTFGVVLEPTFMPGFSLTVDRFRLNLDGIINTVGRQTKANLCYDTADREFCSDLTRGTHPTEAGPWVLLAVNDQLLNVSAYNISGYDVDARYAFEVGRLFRADRDLGNLSISALVTIYDEAEQIPLPGDEPTDLLGAAGGSTSDQGYVRTAGYMNFNYAYGNFGANWHMRYVGSADMAPEGFLPEGFPEIGSYLYHNVRFSYTFGGRTELFAGVTNLFDKQPPFFATSSSGTQALDTIPAYYDVFGRSYFGGFNAKF
jgi:outer membrane receptor protein involved in Fe transport